MPTTELTVSSLAVEKGYGWFSFGVLTGDPYANIGTPATLTTDAAATPVDGSISIFGAWFYEAVRRASPGAKTATCTVQGYPNASGPWTLEQLDLDTSNVVGNTVTARAKWCVSGGGLTTDTDASITWGDSSARETGKLTAPTWATGQLTFTHTYPLHPLDQSYAVQLTSGAQSVTTFAHVPGVGRAMVRPAEGAPGAVVDIQQWPERTHERASSVLPIVGRADPVVLLDTLRLASSSITFLTRDAAENAALLDVLSTPGPLQLLSPCAGVEEVWFTALTTTAARLTTNPADPRRLWETVVQEVAAP
ncbi:hypothetical protein ACFWGL_12390 [Streptomyces sp. NPDC060286]|uniref:hypothetical protein n=1 Tax=unclassified Streptomyces TaxID=2593676 RepID=UPI0035DBCE30